MIRHLTGDATAVRPGRDGCGDAVILAHVVNDVPAWGAGFSGALSRRWPGPDGPEAHYRCWARVARKGMDHDAGPFALGSVQFVGVGGGIIVANMLAQHGIASRGWGHRPMASIASRGPFIRYDALRACLAKVAEAARFNGAEVVCPMIGAGLGGGDWSVIEAMIEEEICGRGVGVTVYRLG